MSRPQSDRLVSPDRPGVRTGIERRSIDRIPAAERHGTPRSQFTLWFGANRQITAIVDGALAVIFGAAVPLVLVIIMYLGFAATGTVLAGQAVNEILHVDAPLVGIVIFGVLTAVVATLGYRYIHALGRVATVVGIIGFSYLMIRLVTSYDLSTLLGQKPFTWVSLLLAVSLGAGWQLTFGPYAADYSRYLPQDTRESTTFQSTLWGSVIGSQWSMTLGALVAALPLVNGKGFLNNQVGFLGELAGGGLVAILIYLVIVVGKLTVNCLNAYGGFMSMLTTVSAFTRTRRISPVVRAAYIGGFLAVSLLVAVVAGADFLSNFKNVVLTLLLVFTPWSAMNLIDSYVVSKERVDIPALYEPEGRYGRWNVVALTCYAFGIVAQIPFLAQALYTGHQSPWWSGYFVDRWAGADGRRLLSVGQEPRQPSLRNDLPRRCGGDA